MSLFDTIQCDYPLPDPELQREEFQTKDLGEMLNRFRITADGRLWRLPRRPDVFAEGDSYPPDTAVETQDMHYHGDICLYAYRGGDRYEYRARFTHGVVEWIRRVGDDAPVAVDTLAALIRDSEALELEWNARLDAFLRRLEQLDPEVAKRVIEVWDDRAAAAHWLATAHPMLDDASPYQALHENRRQDVLEVLGRLQYGLPA